MTLGILVQSSLWFAMEHEALLAVRLGDGEPNRALSIEDRVMIATRHFFVGKSKKGARYWMSERE